jgi:hypothetical protein
MRKGGATSLRTSVPVTVTAISNGDNNAGDGGHDDAGEGSHDDAGEGSHDSVASCSDKSSYSEMSARSNGSRSVSPASPHTRAT